MEIPSRIFFSEEKIKKDLEELKNGKTEEIELYNLLNQAFENLKRNAFCGIQIPKRLIPKKDIIKYHVDNLWKYNLPNAWRLIYTVGKEGVKVLSIILEWLDHKEYEQRFHY
jgi:Txe/YoeB family toxin of Txe-Axe toxin-antitoxin module